MVRYCGRSARTLLTNSHQGRDLRWRRGRATDCPRSADVTSGPAPTLLGSSQTAASGESDTPTRRLSSHIRHGAHSHFWGLVVGPAGRRSSPQHPPLQAAADERERNDGSFRVSVRCVLLKSGRRGGAQRPGRRPERRQSGAILRLSIGNKLDT